MAGGGGDVDSLLLGSDSEVPVRFCGRVGCESGEVRLCLRPTSSDGDVGRDDTGGVWARRVGTRVVVG